MLNVLQFSGQHGGRGHRAHRQSILDMDCYISDKKAVTINNNDVLGKTYASHESLRPDSASSGRGSRGSDSGDELEYQILKALVDSGEKILVSDLRNVLRTHRAAHLNGEEPPHPAYRGCHPRFTSGRRRDSVKPRAALKVLSAVPIKNCDIAVLEERQAVLCWAFSELAYANEPLDRHELFSQVKEAHREIFKALEKSGESERSPRRLHFLLRFSQLCLDYAEWCDEGAVQMVTEALRALKTCNRSRASSRVGARDTSGESLSERRHRELVHLICNNLHNVETLRLRAGVTDRTDVMV